MAQRIRTRTRWPARIAGGFSGSGVVVPDDPGGPGLGFAAQSGYTVTGAVADGEDLLISSSGGDFGSKFTQHPYMYDLIDRGCWMAGNFVANPYGGITVGAAVPTGSGRPFLTQGGTPRFRAASGLGPGRSVTYGGSLVNDGHDSRNVTLRHASPEWSINEGVTPQRPNYFLSWMWNSNFTPWSDGVGGAAKFIRIWGIKGNQFGRYRVSWTRDLLDVLEVESANRPSYPNTDVPPNTWNQFEFGARVADGGFTRAWVNGGLLHDVTIAVLGAGWSGGVWMRQWGYDPSVAIASSSYQINMSDFYSDASHARVVLTDSASLASSTSRIPQMHTSWTANQIQCRDLYASRLQTLAGRHLHVMREDGASVYVGQIGGS